MAVFVSITKGVGNMRSYQKIDKNNKNYWEKNTYRRRIIILTLIPVLVVYFILAIVISQSLMLKDLAIITIIAFIPISLAIIFVAKKIPQYIKINNQGVYFRYGKKEELIFWSDVEKIAKVDYGIEKRWEMFLRNGKIQHINFISRDIIRDMRHRLKIYRDKVLR